ncbi:MAG TPA: hypothetical protein VFJ74_00245 [Gemmatimonadaceae bacterium]|nr:hypothetical protein [Gemmatimonadaceae bacterium]
MSFRTTLRSAAGAIALAAVAAACTDKQPTQPKAATAATPVVAAAVVTSRPANGSTVCLAYMNKRAEAKTRLDKALDRARALAAKKVAEPEADVKARAELKRRNEKFEALVADACR